VDYSLYILSVTLARMRSGESLHDAYHAALLFTGRVVMLTGVTLAAGVATWIFSPIKFQSDMGLLLAFMFLWNMLGALVLLPALASFLLRSTARPASATHAGVPQAEVRATRATPRAAPQTSTAPATAADRSSWR